MRRIGPFFPLPRGRARVDDRRGLSGIIYVIRNGLTWRNAPQAYGPRKALDHRFVRWSRMDVFNRIFAGPAAKSGAGDQRMVDAAPSEGAPDGRVVAQKGMFRAVSGARKAA